MANNVYDYVLNKYNDTSYKCEHLDNGVIKITKPNGDMIYIPPASIDSVYALWPGSGGSKTDSELMREIMETSSTPPSYMVTIAKYSYSNSSTLVEGINIAAENGMTVDKLVTQTFSASGWQSFKEINDIYASNPDLNLNTTMLVVDAYPEGYNPNINHNLEALRENGVNVVFINPEFLEPKASKPKEFDPAKDRYDLGQMMYADIQNNGIENAYLLQLPAYGINMTDHKAMNELIITSGMAQYFLGLTDDIKIGDDYKFFKYNPESNTYTINATLQDLVMYSWDNKYQELVTLSQTRSDIDAIVSNYDKISSAMQNIVSNISTEYAQPAVMESTASIPKKLAQAETQLLNVSKNLTDNLTKETALITQMAQIICEMDAERAMSADGLSMLGNLDAKLSTTLSSIDNNYSEVYNARFLFENNEYTAGTVGKILIADLDGPNVSNLLSNLENEETAASDAYTHIEEAQRQITSMEDDLWKQVNNKLDAYKDLMTLRGNSAKKLKEAFEKAIKIIKDYIAPDEEIDDGKLPEFRDKYDKITADIKKCHDILDSLSLITKDPETGEEVINVDAFKRQASIQQLLREYNITQEELKKDIEKLELLPEKMKDAEDVINTALSQIYSEYVSAVSDLVTGIPRQYIPPVQNSSVPQVDEVKITREQYESNPRLFELYGTYDEFLEKYVVNGKLTSPIVINQQTEAYKAFQYGSNNFYYAACGACSAIAAISLVKGEFLSVEEAARIGNMPASSNYGRMENILNENGVIYYNSQMTVDKIGEYLTPGSTINFDKTNNNNGNAQSTVSIENPVGIVVQGEAGESQHIMCVRAHIDENGNTQYKNGEILLDVFDSNGGKIYSGVTASEQALKGGNIWVMDAGKTESVTNANSLLVADQENVLTLPEVSVQNTPTSSTDTSAVPKEPTNANPLISSGGRPGAQTQQDDTPQNNTPSNQIPTGNQNEPSSGNTPSYTQPYKPNPLPGVDSSNTETKPSVENNTIHNQGQPNNQTQQENQLNSNPINPNNNNRPITNNQGNNTNTNQDSKPSINEIPNNQEQAVQNTQKPLEQEVITVHPSGARPNNQTQNQQTTTNQQMDSKPTVQTGSNNQSNTTSSGISSNNTTNSQGSNNIQNVPGQNDDVSNIQIDDSSSNSHGVIKPNVDDTITEEQFDINNSDYQANKSNKVLKTIGEVLAAGAATGAAIYGINRYKQFKNESENSNEDDFE